MVDAGTSGVRASVVRPGGPVHTVRRRSALASTPDPGFVEIDARALAGVVSCGGRGVS